MQTLPRFTYAARASDARLQNLEVAETTDLRRECHKAPKYKPSCNIAAPASPAACTYLVESPDPGLALPRNGLGFSEANIINLVEAAKFADVINTPLNTYVVIRLRDASSTPQHALGEFLEKFGKALGCRGILRRWIWTLEIGGYVGPHLNLLAFIPVAHRRELLSRLRSQVAATLGLLHLPRFTLDAQPITPPADNTLRYIMKGCCGPAHRLLLRLTPNATLSWPPCTDECSISGKKCGVSESLGLTARARFNSGNR